MITETSDNREEKVRSGWEKKKIFQLVPAGTWNLMEDLCEIFQKQEESF